MYLRMRIDGTPITITWPPWPPDANVRYSSMRPVGVYVLSAAWTSASFRLRAFISSDRVWLVPPLAVVVCEPLLQAPSAPSTVRDRRRGLVVGLVMVRSFGALTS